MDTPSPARNVLRQYWGFDQFRPLQEDIITSVAERRDTLALLPTGGGKSICYQVPALIQDGICIVISPLVALMKDQVQRLKRIGVRAEAIYSGMGRHSIDRILDNCIYGNVKLLYISPERLQSHLAEERIKKMNVSFVAVDEAHCISQWGHDFRPAYLGIPVIRDWHPRIPILALTATATPAVCDDIVKHLQMSSPAQFVASFKRENLSLLVHRTDDKLGVLKRSLESLNGSAIVYVRSRRKSREVAELLYASDIKCKSYHAGMSHQARERVQAQWLSGEIPVIACTTAFGMGIDKSNVRIVVHYDLPPSLEEYYQEAGRAGRDGEPAQCLVLYNEADVRQLQDSVRRSHPSVKDVLNIYRALYSFHHLPVDSDEPIDFPFDLNAFGKRYRVDAYNTFQSLRVLEREGWIAMSEGIYSPSRLQIEVSAGKLRQIQQSDQSTDEILVTLLRQYEGLFVEPVRISEQRVAELCDVDKADVVALLQRLDKDGVVQYSPASDLPRIIFLHPRVDFRNVNIEQTRIEQLRKRSMERMASVLDFVNGEDCREKLLLAYFDEDSNQPCGRCDFCRREKGRGRLSADSVLAQIGQGDLTIKELIHRFGVVHTDEVTRIVSVLEDEELVKVLDDRIYPINREDV